MDRIKKLMIMFVFLGTVSNSVVCAEDRSSPSLQHVSDLNRLATAIDAYKQCKNESKACGDYGCNCACQEHECKEQDGEGGKCYNDLRGHCVDKSGNAVSIY